MNFLDGSSTTALPNPVIDRTIAAGRWFNILFYVGKFSEKHLNQSIFPINFSNASAVVNTTPAMPARRAPSTFTALSSTNRHSAGLSERVFFNLLSNALKYTPDNGAIDVSYAVDGNNLVFRVADTGEGISERDLGNIFDRFFQVDRIHPKGSGIGLSLAKAFVELHGGTIAVESTLNKGSVFTVTLPLVHVAQTAVGPDKRIELSDVTAELDTVDSETVFDSEKPMFLIIDDNRDIRMLLSELLNADYNILTASNGKEGIRMAARYVPDLIICDVMMPVMDGMECRSEERRGGKECRSRWWPGH